MALLPWDALLALTPTQRLSRFLLVGAIVSGVASLFLYTGGWFSPRRLTPARFIDTFESINGKRAGFRRNHAKGVGVRGVFDSNGQGARLSKAVVFRPGRVPVVGRFALAGGMPYGPDAVQTVRSMALAFRLADGEEWRTGMNALPVFAVSTPEAFRDQLVAMAQDPATGKPDPARVNAFLARYPATARAIHRIQAEKPASGFESSTYNSLNAFVLTDSRGHSTHVRWSMVPESQAGTPAGTPVPPSANFLFDALIASVHRQPLRWHLIMTLGGPADPTDDATIEWPAAREKINFGTLTIDHVESEESSPARTINFDPLVLPEGMAGSDDPLLSARSATYAESFRRRVGEHVSPSAVTSAEVGDETP
jgi:catalase